MGDEAGPSSDGTAGTWPPPLAYVASPYEEAMWDRDLDQNQRGWRPEGQTDLWRQVLSWKEESTIAELDGEVVEVIELTCGADPTWDWRTVAFWSAALGPGWRVHLRHPGRIDLISPPVQPPAR